MTGARSVRLSQKGQFVIPKEMRDALGVKEGDELLVILEKGRMILTRPREYAKRTRGALRGTWGTARNISRDLTRERRSWR
ncbi:MAG TPA: AbrB/MazE/SpoVT family DNA-binding domain-containing protein [Candidatus Limnocylindria bacterium]|nr:AbrB/MazE/SpoVT family DNA-binding domain-containing protein [Candidatus Limnocylindria bacterium]